MLWRGKGLSWMMVLATVLILSTPLWAAAQQDEDKVAIFDTQVDEDNETADVVIRGQTALQLSGELGGLAADERARIVARRLSGYFSNGGSVPGIRPQIVNGSVVVAGDQQQVLVTVPPEGVTDGTETTSAEKTALQWANRIRTLLGADPLTEDVLNHLQPAQPQLTAAAAQTLQEHSGTTTWYGDAFHGRRTASGTAFDMNKLTAAHKSWPFGTIVRVTSHSTQKSVVVEINDRGPFVPGYDLDLSKAAAAQIGIIGKGVDKVKMEILRWGN